MKKTMIIITVIVLVLVGALGLNYWYAYGRISYKMPDRMMYYDHGQMCEITDEAAMEKFLSIAERFEIQSSKDWRGLPDFDVNAIEMDASIEQNFPENCVIRFAYDSEEYDYQNYDVYYFLDEHYSFKTGRNPYGIEHAPNSNYMATWMISWKTCHAYSQEMENAVKEFGLYELLE